MSGHHPSAPGPTSLTVALAVKELTWQVVTPPAAERATEVSRKTVRDFAQPSPNPGRNGQKQYVCVYMGLAPAREREIRERVAFDIVLRQLQGSHAAFRDISFDDVPCGHRPSWVTEIVQAATMCRRRHGHLCRRTLIHARVRAGTHCKHGVRASQPGADWAERRDTPVAGRGVGVGSDCAAAVPARPERQ